MDIQIVVTVTVPDGIVNFMGVDKVGAALGDNIGASLDDMMENNPGMIEDFSVESPDEGSEESDAEEIVPRRAPQTTKRDVPAPQKPVPARAEGGMSGGARPAAPKGQGTGKTGRPPTLHDHMASDGDVVRASGTRGIATLVDQGVKVYRVEGDRKIRIGADGEPLTANKTVTSSGGRSASRPAVQDDEEDERPAPRKSGGKPHFAAKTR